MATRPDGMNCTTASWGVAALAGLLVLLVLWALPGLGFLGSLVIGLLVMVAAGLFISWAFCKPMRGSDEPSAANPTVGDEVAGPPKAGGRPAATIGPQPTGVAPPFEPEQPEPAPNLDREPGTAGPVVERSQGAPRTEGGAPQLLVEPEGEPDDLQRIRGIGPKMAQKLNGLGVWHYRQIAAWGDTEVAWVDDQLDCRGRIGRDDWVGQARALAAGEDVAASPTKDKG